LIPILRKSPGSAATVHASAKINAFNAPQLPVPRLPSYRLFWCSLSLFLSMTTAYALAAPPLLAVDHKKINQVFAQYTNDTPGCALGIYRNGKVLFARGYGLAELSHSVPIKPHTVFDIGSTSKQFTALAIALLAHDGKLSLQDRVRQYLPELSAAHDNITLEQMLWHTAGLRDYNELLLMAGYAEEDPTGEAAALRVVRAQAKLNFVPGSQFSYSNSGYFLAALVAERVSGMGLDAFLQQRVFQPLRMKVSHVRTDHTQVVSRRATAYRQTDLGYAINMANWNQPGDGAVQSSVQDLVLWDAELANPHVLPPAVVRALQTPGQLANGERLSYALGLEIDRYRGLKRILHDGSWAGYRATYMRFPEQQLGLALTCNTAEADPNALVEQVVDIVLSRHVLPDTRRKSARKATTPNAVAIDASGFVGQYLEDQGAEVIRIALNSQGNLLWQHAEGATVISTVAQDVVQTPSGMTLLQLTPHGLVMRSCHDGSVKKFARLAPYHANKADTAAMVGSFVSEELGVTWDVQQHKGLALQLQSRGLANPLVQSVAPDLWRGPDFLLRVQRNAQDNISGLVYDSERVRGINFIRINPDFEPR